MRRLLYEDDVIDAINKRISVLQKHPEFRRKHADIDLYGIKQMITELPSAQPTLRERALMLLLNWAVECDFGYDNFPEEYERYKDEIEDMSYFDGMIYIAEKEVERNG